MIDLGIHDLLDDVVCGNDPGIVPKPSPHCAMQICKRLNVEHTVSYFLKGGV